MHTGITGITELAVKKRLGEPVAVFGEPSLTIFSCG